MAPELPPVGAPPVPPDVAGSSEHARTGSKQKTARKKTFEDDMPQE
jgi:hypothetical protein